MKKGISFLLAALVVLSLAGCSSTPSDEKIKTALEDGTITIKDAKAKGWIDEAWIEANFDPIEAKSKIYLFDPFETTYLDGNPVSSEIIEGKMCLVFFNTENEATMDKLQIFNEVCTEMEKIGVPVLGIITDEDVDTAREKLTEVNFPIIVYNEEMQNSLEKYGEIISTDVVSVFTKEGGFYTAWQHNAQTEDLLSFARELANEES